MCSATNEVKFLDINKEYVDIEDALKRIGGSMPLYKKLLASFTGGDHIAPLEKALETGATEDASRLIHTLKGVASNLSLKKLSSVASELEHSIKDGTDHSGSLAELISVYQTTAEEIGKIS